MFGLDPYTVAGMSDGELRICADDLAAESRRPGAPLESIDRDLRLLAAELLRRRVREEYVAAREALNESRAALMRAPFDGIDAALDRQRQASKRYERAAARATAIIWEAS